VCGTCLLASGKRSGPNKMTSSMQQDRQLPASSSASLVERPAPSFRTGDFNLERSVG
jgi:hypothetical protein